MRCCFDLRIAVFVSRGLPSSFTHGVAAAGQDPGRTGYYEDPELTDSSGSCYLIITIYFLFADAGRNFAIGINGNMECIINNEIDALACDPHLCNISCRVLTVFN